jgi:hypothetical protein
MTGAATAQKLERRVRGRQREYRNSLLASVSAIAIETLATDDRQKLREPCGVRLLPSAMQLSALDAVVLARVVRSGRLGGRADTLASSAQRLGRPRVASVRVAGRERSGRELLHLKRAVVSLSVVVRAKLMREGVRIGGYGAVTRRAARYGASWLVATVRG